MSEKGLPELAKETVADLNRLVKLELELAGERVKAEARKKAVGAGALATGGLLALYALLFLLAAGAAALAIVWPWWLALLVVGGAVLLLALMAAMVGARRLRSSSGIVPDDAKGQIKEDVQWLREKSA